MSARGTGFQPVISALVPWSVILLCRGKQIASRSSLPLRGRKIRSGRDDTKADHRLESLSHEAIPVIAGRTFQQVFFRIPETRRGAIDETL